MALDLSNLSPEAQALYRKIGANYDSGRTLAQAEKTRNGVKKVLDLYPEALSLQGVRISTVTRLEDARAALLEATAGREHTRTQKKVTNVAHIRAMFDGKGTRLELHAAYNSARRILLEAGDRDSVNLIDVTLGRTKSAGADSDVLINQLELLGELLTNTAIRQAVADGDETIPTALETAVAERIAALNSTRIDKAAPRGTPIDTGLIDLLDGMIIVICRDIRRAVRALARSLGQPHLAEEVELNELYKSIKRTKNEEGGDPAAG